MKRHFSLLVIVAACACSQVDSYLPQLLEIEDIIQTHPRDAHARLISLDGEKICNSRDKALYSLLYSMALDKNYIDVASDSIIAPAVKFFSSSSDQRRKFMAYYYLGRVQENGEDYEKALSSYIKAERIKPIYVPDDYLCRLYTRKGCVYYHQFALDKALAEFNKSQSLAMGLGNPDFYINCALDRVSVLDAMGRPEEAFKETHQLSNWISTSGALCPLRYYSSVLRLSLLRHKIDDEAITIDDAYREYVQQCLERGQDINHMLAADYFLYKNEPRKALQELKQEEGQSYSDTFTSIQYYATLAEVHKRLANFESALESHERCDSLLSSVNLAVHNNDVRFLEERTESELAELKQKNRIGWLCLLLSISLVAFAYALYRYVSNKRYFEEEFAKASNEYLFLKTIAEANRKYPVEVKSEIDARILALKPFIDLKQKDLFKLGDVRNLKDINNKRIQMRSSIGLIYAALYPGFVSALSRKGLTAEEIGLCCMYLAGYSSKEIDIDPFSNNLYQENRQIRKTLGLPANGIKLTTWLRNLFEDTEVSTQGKNT